MIAAPAILTDTTRCTGCEACVGACKSVNHLAEDRPRSWKGRVDDLSSTRYTTIVRSRDEKGVHFARQQCRHCLEPACASACIVGALKKTPEGPVAYDDSKCMGCRYCMVACPFGIPRYDWEKAVPYVRKCNLCYDRLKAGEQPGCTEACPYDATVFGTRDELLAVARERIADAPGRYIDRIYGEREVGGTSVLMISDIPLDFLSLKADLGETPLPELTWASLNKVPPAVLGMGGLMAGIYWTIGRRMEMQTAAAEVSSEDSDNALSEEPSE
jgi:formate dehydrogenase iron-sulfur subunit